MIHTIGIQIPRHLLLISNHAILHSMTNLDDTQVKWQPQWRTILFLCTGNACRSPMAEAMARSMRPDLIVLSAGVVQTGVQPGTLNALREIGLDGAEPKTLKEIGEMMNLSRERIRQIEAQALEKLNRSQKCQHLRGYLN